MATIQALRERGITTDEWRRRQDALEAISYGDQCHNHLPAYGVVPRMAMWMSERQKLSWWPQDPRNRRCYMCQDHSDQSWQETLCVCAKCNSMICTAHRVLNVGQWTSAPTDLRGGIKVFCLYKETCQKGHAVMKRIADKFLGPK